MSQDVRAPDRGQAGAICGDKLNHAQEACGFGRVLVHRVDRRGRRRLFIRRRRALSLGTAEQTDPAGRADNDGISGRRADPEIAFPAAVEMNPPGFEYPVPKSFQRQPDSRSADGFHRLDRDRAFVEDHALGNLEHGHFRRQIIVCEDLADRRCLLLVLEIDWRQIDRHAKQSIASRKNGLLRRGACHRARIRATRWLPYANASRLSQAMTSIPEAPSFLTARLRPRLAPRTCAASVPATCRHPPGMVAGSRFRREPADRRGTLVKLMKPMPMCRRSSGHGNSSPAQAPSARRGRRSNP